jgi:hypothetical protein
MQTGDIADREAHLSEAYKLAERGDDSGRFKNLDWQRALDVARASVAKERQRRIDGLHGVGLGTWLEQVASVAELPEARQALQEALAIYRDLANHRHELGRHSLRASELHQADLRKLEQHVARVEQQLLNL